MSNKRKSPVSTEEALNEKLREANGMVKDLRHEISRAKETLPGLRKEIDDELDARFEEILNKKICEMYKHCDDIMEEIAEGTVNHFGQMTILLYRMLPVLSESPLMRGISVTELVTIITEILEEQKAFPSKDFKYFVLKDLTEENPDVSGS